MKIIIKSNDKDDKMSIILNELKELRNEIEIIKSKIEDNKENNIVNIKKEELRLDKEYIIEMLNHRNHITEINIFNKYYMDEKECPIKVEGMRKIYIYINNKWVLDMDGKILTDILCQNIQRTLTSINTTDNIKNMGNFIENQIYINKFNNYNYCRDVYKNIRTHIIKKC